MVKAKHFHFVQSLEPLEGGGLGAAALQLHQAMGRQGYQSTLVATRNASFPDSWSGVIQSSRCGPKRSFYAPDLKEQMPSDPSTVLHGHGFYVYPNYLFGCGARRRRLPLVYHAHGFFEPWILNRSRMKKRFVGWLFEDANFRAAKLWRALTAKEADQIRNVIGKSANVVVAPNGIDLSPFAGPPLPRRGKRRAVFLARLHPKKGLDLLVNAWAALPRATNDWELVIAGPDELGHRAVIESQIRASDLTDKICFVGAVSGEKKINLLRSADLFVLCSYSEGLPMAPLEAMAARVPVLITHECNLPDVLHQEAGWCCSANQEEVTTALKAALLASDEERCYRGANGRKLVEESFTWERTVGMLAEACRTLPL